MLSQGRLRVSVVGHGAWLPGSHARRQWRDRRGLSVCTRPTRSVRVCAQKVVATESVRRMNSKAVMKKNAHVEMSLPICTSAASELTLMTEKDRHSWLH